MMNSSMYVEIVLDNVCNVAVIVTHYDSTKLWNAIQIYP